MTRTLAALTAATLLSTIASARDADLASWQNLGRLTAGQRIQVVRSNHETLKGEFISFAEESIGVRVKQQETSVPRADVRQVQFEGSRKKAVWIGVAIGAGGGLAVGAAVAYGVSNRSGGDFAALKPAITAVVAAIGALSGAVIGSLAGGHPHTIYQAK